jgi:hypothetical protein
MEITVEDATASTHEGTRRDRQPCTIPCRNTDEEVSMKPITIFAMLIITSAPMWGQTVTPFNEDKLTFTELNGTVYTEGHWVETDGRGNAMPSVSAISCSQPTKTCVEDVASYSPLGGTTFSLDASHNEYEIERWTPTEIVASTINGLCAMRHTLKILLKEKRILVLDAPSEPIKSTGNAGADKMLQICRETTSFELKGGKMFWSGGKK